MRFIAGVRIFRAYERAWALRDLVAGLVLTAFLIPVGMGYAQAAGLPPITGLYATIIPLLAYALFGPSRVMVLGPDSSLAALIAAIVAPLAADDPSRAVALAGGLAIVTGIIIAGAGVLRLGFVTELLSRPVQLGYLAGVALLIVLGQTPKLCGLTLVTSSIGRQLVELLHRLHDVNLPSVGLGLGAVALIAAQRRFIPKVPGALLAVIAGILIVRVLHLESRGVRTLGRLPQGFPSFVIPALSWSDVSKLATGALGIALVAVADTTVLSQSLAGKRTEDVDPDEELLALGMANVAAGFFGGFPISSSSSRTPVAISAGSKTQLTGIVGALAIVLLLIVGPDLLSSLPQPVLSGIVLVAAYGLVDASTLVTLFRRSRAEFVLFAVAFVGVTVLGVLTGIFVAIVLSLGDFVRRAWRPHDAVLGYVAALGGYHDVSRHPEATQQPGLVIYRFDAPLFFANARHFRARVRALALADRPRVRNIVVAAEPITDVDTSAAYVLEALRDELSERGISLVFAELKDPVRDRLRRYGLVERFGEESFFPDVELAVDALYRTSRSSSEDRDRDA